ncbi:MAG: orotate phosphoribosyltransferase [Tissierellia bacterium]|nr:orotate phosphoribosyltransferase [Tissierellia bacterium]
MEIRELLKKRHALLEGHFGLSSGKHSDVYVQCAKATEYPEDGAIIAARIKEKLDAAGIEVDVVVGPAMGGIIIGYELAKALNVRSMFTERKDGEMCFRRGFAVQPGEKVIICEDVVTTGKSSMETAKAIEAMGGEVVGIGAIVDRTKEQPPLPVYASIKIDANLFEPEQCPLCEKGIALDQPGSRFLKK